jgi:hypothetical protein
MNGPRRFPPPGLRPVTRAGRTRGLAHKIGLDGLLRVTRRYEYTNALRVFSAFFAVIAVVILAGLAWLWLFR